ncbi:clan AA aspartic protease [Candidatus Peribacteria bacterium RIFCSPLOWO2_01_FULL_51_18]|nr:MAG: clan AA aspartic protease [Candidatus Peribacteria bacterium RIFCSPHIGHO2_02_FULL_51_15]OGJ66760.1 MAG: clan AA aspartic protease [Candidatus Peribacteria bacterium RIFCSPLOWO2_01_FULL_51_18]OGJ67222.1 MAG: clan AA aspartic protease [Candidatus Peribacteria bacterium RIFCSPLOWO2_02_FULL_51_10]
MGLAYATLQLSNPRLPDLLPITVRSLVDTGALHLCVPSHVALQLKLEELQKREVVTADGKKMLCPYVGPVEITYDGRSCYTGAVILGDEVLLGAVPMEDMDLVVSPAKRSVIANPESPNIPLSVAKGVRW